MRIVIDCENDLQKYCMRYLDKLGIKYFHKYNYGSQKNRKSVHKKYKGWPDLTIPLKDITIYIELKMPGKKLTPEQGEWQQYFIDHKQPFYVVDNFVQFKNIIERWN